MQKTIIGVWGTANVGKSMTLASLGRQLQTAGGITETDISEPKTDYRAVFEYLSHTIGIQTFGDVEQLVVEGLEHFLNTECEIVAIASKGYGGTVDAIVAFARNNNYRIIWVTPYDTRDELTEFSTLKAYGASHLLRMIDDTISSRI